MTLRATDDQTVRVFAIIVTYNSAATLPTLLDSLDASPTAVHALVVDNGSVDGTPAIAREYPVTVIETGHNLGYSGGINVGRRNVPANRHVGILNPDLKVAEDCLPKLVAVLEDDPTVGIAVPRLLNMDGTRFDSLRREPSILGAFGDSIFGNRWPSRPRVFAETMRREEEYARARDVAWAGGAALLISSACNEKVGSWDDDTYFLYSEETDYASRARACGFRVSYEPAARAWHIGSASGQPGELVALMSVNRVRYFSHRHGRVRTFAFRIGVAVQHLIRIRDPRHRVAFRHVIDRTSWSRLPNGSRPATRRSDR